MNLENGYKTTMVGTSNYVIHKDDIQFKALIKHQRSKALHSVPKETERYLSEAATTETVLNSILGLQNRRQECSKGNRRGN